LREQKTLDPVRFPDLSLSVVKLMGAGEYVAERVAGEGTGHFGLAVRDYAHSTAPNRRYPDLITQRLLKAALANKRCPYSVRELDSIASHCSAREEAIKKVERQVEKSAAALLLEDRVGERFEGIVSGLSEFGAWVRLLDPPVEGRLNEAGGVTSGQAVTVELLRADVGRGFVDFRRVLRRGKFEKRSDERAPRERDERRGRDDGRRGRDDGRPRVRRERPGDAPVTPVVQALSPPQPALKPVATVVAEPVSVPPTVDGAPKRKSKRPVNTVPKAFRKKQRTGKRKPPPKPGPKKDPK
jgi:hypothetical protein